MLQSSRAYSASVDVIAELVCVCAGDYLYWTDWIQREVGRVHKHNGTHRTVILEQLSDLMGIKAVNISAVQGLYMQRQY